MLDIVGVLNSQDDYTKNRNYWKYLKTKLKNEGNEVVSVTNQLKLLAPDGKRRLTDVLDYDGVVFLAKNRGDRHEQKRSRVVPRHTPFRICTSQTRSMTDKPS